MKDADKKSLIAALTHVDQKTLDGIKQRFRAIRRNQSDLNSRFPATMEFLATRGLAHVDQLDKEGLKELERHLEKTLSDLTPNKA